LIRVERRGRGEESLHDGFGSREAQVEVEAEVGLAALL